MIKIEFTKNETAHLRLISQNHSHQHIRRKALALLLKSQGIPHHQIAEIIKRSENTVRTYFYEYIKRGINALLELNFRKPISKLVSFETILKNYLDQTPPATVKQACDEIDALTGISLKETQMRKHLKSLGAKFRKVIGIPAKANIEQQKAFLETELQPRLEEAKSGKRMVYFVDAAHFVLGAFLGYSWSIKRVLVKTPSGRQRLNVLGALDAISKKLTTITNDTYITSIQVCDLLRILVLQTKKSITVVLDNSRYQRCDMVTRLAEELGIELLFLPPYSPNLNLIERVWKFTKKRCLNSRYYKNFELFQNAISSFLTSMHQSFATELNSLLTLKFQILEASN